MSTISLFEAPGPHERRSQHITSFIVALAFLGLAALAVRELQQENIFSPDHWAVLGRSDLQEALRNGVLATLKVAAVSIVLSLLLGLGLAVARMSHNRWISGAARIWTEALRGLPELLLIFFIYLGVPALTGANISTFWALVTGLVLYESTSMAEVFRSGFRALPNGQTEAAHALGLRTFKTLRFVQLPQVVPQVLPSLVSEMVRVTKASSLGFVIGYTDLLLSGELAIEYLGGQYAVPVFAAVAALYVTICLVLSWISHYLSARL